MSNFSVVCGNEACPNDCPFCISKQTEACHVGKIDFNWSKFSRAIRYVKEQHPPVSTCLITGRGEPLLFRPHLMQLLGNLKDYFPCIELQTSGVAEKGMAYYDLPQKEREDLYVYGLTTLCLSACSLYDAENRDLMRMRNHPTFSIRQAVRVAVADGFTVRLSFQMNKIAVPGQLWSERKQHMLDIIHDAQQLGAKQITFRMIGKPDHSVNKEAADWVDQYGFPNAGAGLIEVMGNPRSKSDPEPLGKKLATYHWGGMIYDVDGMSVCIADCLTEDPNGFEPRSWIYDGKDLRYSWQYKGAIVF